MNRFSEGSSPHRTALHARRVTHALGAAALLLACAAHAQSGGSVNDYRLPPAPAVPAPRVQGPVDPETPSSTPPPASTTPAAPPTAAAPSPATTPRIVLPPVEPTRRARQTVRAATPDQTEAERPGATVPAATPSYAPDPSATVAPRLVASEPAVAPESGEPGGHSAWLLIGAVALLIVGGFLFWMRRRERAERAWDRREVDAAPPAQPQPQPQLQPGAPAALPQPVPPPSPDRAEARLTSPHFEGGLADEGPIELTLEARHLSRAMINATLAYRLSITNRGDAPLASLSIAGDLTTAHAAVPVEQQLSLGGTALTPLHQVPALAPGATVDLPGELRLPLAEIRPIPSGHGHVFVPLARFRIDCGGVETTRIFVIGRIGEDSGGTLLRPFVLGQGPGVQREIGQRALRPLV